MGDEKMGHGVACATNTLHVQSRTDKSLVSQGRYVIGVLWSGRGKDGSVS
jgi:hypothetical protein